EIGDMRIDFNLRRVTVSNIEIHLTVTEYDILRLFAIHAGKVLTHEFILKAVWDPDDPSNPGQSHMLRVNISNLRHKIENDPSRPKYIITEPGVGYRLKNF
ncbi:MAG: winged helix-turn-helix domain-containing protein, partial [Desulfuromonadales bacterium]|nr:winged helix-turn-helix domain-containing protein [Desulfuromonadales bacterium]